jgi:ferredoxin
MDFSTKFAAGLSYRDFLAAHGTEEQRQRWQGVHDRVQLSEAQHALLASFKRQMKLLCLAGAWCGDCVEQCPILDRFAAASPAIELRLFDRDAHEDLKNALSICGGARVPVVVFLSEEGHEAARFGDRTLSKYRRLAADQLGPACPTGIVPQVQSLLDAVTQDWLDQFERVQLLLRTSPRLRQKHGD